MRVEFDIDVDVLDELVVQRLKDALEDCMMFSTDAKHPDDRHYCKKMVKALKRVIKHFEV